MPTVENNQEKIKQVLQYDQVLLRLELYIASCGSARKFAREVGISEVHVSKVRMGRALAGPKLLKAIGLKQIPPTFEEADEEWV